MMKGFFHAKAQSNQGAKENFAPLLLGALA